MLNKGHVTQGAEGAAWWGALADPSAHALPLNPRARAEQLLRIRLLQARERGSRWHQKRKHKSPKRVRAPSADLHRAYREPMPPPPPNSPRFNVLGLPTPLLGVPFINPRAMLASASPPPTAHAHDADSEGEDFDSDGFRDLDSCAGDQDGGDSGRCNARSPRKSSRAASRRVQERAKKCSFFDVFYSAVKQEAKRRAAINLADLGSTAVGAKASPKKRVRFRESAYTLPEDNCRFEGESPHSGLQSLRVLSPDAIYTLKADGRGDVKYENVTYDTLGLQNSKYEFDPEGDIVHSLPPLVVKKDKVITNYLKSTTHEPFSRPLVNRGNNLRVTQSTYQKSDPKHKNKNMNQTSFLAKRHEVGTQKIIEELTEGGIHFSSLFDVGKMNASKASNAYTPSCIYKNRSNSPPINVDSVLYDTCEIANAITRKEKATDKQNELSSFSAAHRLYLSAKSSMERSRKNEKLESKEEAQTNRKSIYRPKDSSEKNNGIDIWAKSICKVSNNTHSGLKEVAKHNSPVNIENEIARNEALAREIDESLAHAFSQSTSFLDQSTGTSDVANHITPQENSFSNVKTCGLSSEYSTIANKKISSMKLRSQKLTDQDAVFGLIKEMVKLKRARNLT